MPWIDTRQTHCVMGMRMIKGESRQLKRIKRKGIRGKGTPVGGTIGGAAREGMEIEIEIEIGDPTEAGQVATVAGPATGTMMVAENAGQVIV